MQIRDATFVVTDTETTGVKAGTDRLIEVGAVKVRGGEVVDRFQQLVNPERSVPSRIARLTGITSAMVFDQPVAAAVLPRYLAFLGDAVLVAHNLPFDRRFLDAELERMGRPPLANDMLCTLRLARRLLPGLPSKGLSRLADFYKIRVEGRHRALGDAEATAVVLKKFLSQLEFEHEVETVEALLAFQRRPYREVRRVPSHLRRLREEVLPGLPDGPGVYFMKDSSGATIYIGKASRLEDRVRSYFRAVEAHDERTRRLVRAVRDVEWTETPSELDALFLESRLIKEHKPRFNRAQRRYRSRPFIRLDATDDFPSVSWARRWAPDGAEYFGPLGGRRQAEFVLDVLQRFFALRECDDDRFRRGQRCLYASIGRCTAPCEGGEGAAGYDEVVHQVRAFLTGRDRSLLGRIQEKMEGAAARMEYERAAEYRDWQARAERFLNRRRFVASSVQDHHAVLVQHAESGVRIYAVRYGQHAGTFVPEATGAVAEGALEQWLDAHFGPDAAPEELSKRAVDEMRLLTHWMYRHRAELAAVPWTPAQPAEAFRAAVREAVRQGAHDPVEASRA